MGFLITTLLQIYWKNRLRFDRIMAMSLWRRFLVHLVVGQSMCEREWHSGGVTSHRQPWQCRGTQGPRTVNGAQSDPNYVSRLLARSECLPGAQKITVTPLEWHVTNIVLRKFICWITTAKQWQQSWQSACKMTVLLILSNYQARPAVSTPLTRGSRMLPGKSPGE